MPGFTMIRFHSARGHSVRGHSARGHSAWGHSAWATVGRLSDGGLIRSLRIVLRTYLTRRALPDLTPRERADIGISASAALAEAARLPWDINLRRRRPTSGILGAIERALERARTRRLIGRLEARELRDIGASASAAEMEASKAFWRP
jgi:uncharacterized protein YjiS (DUF1127 family)